MKITEIPTEGYERVVRCDDPDSGLKAIISVHDTTLGRALETTVMSVDLPALGRPSKPTSANTFNSRSR